MKNEVAFLKRVAGDIGGSVQGFYAFSNGWMFAGNSAMQAGVPYQFAYECAVPATEIDLAVGRMANPKAVVRDDMMVVTDKKLRTTIRCLPYDTVTTYPPDLDADTLPVPPDLIDAIAKALPFVSKEGTWQTGVYVDSNRVLGCNNKSAIEVKLTGTRFPTAILTSDSAEYIVEHKPDRYRTHGNGGLLFKWDDGRWLRVQTLAYSLPEGLVERILDSLGTDAPVPITDDFRAAVEDAGAMGDKIELRADRMVARRDNSLSEVAIKSPIPADHRSLWEYRLLAMVMPVAVSWNPLSAPNASLFVAPGIRGAIMSVRV